MLSMWDCEIHLERAGLVLRFDREGRERIN